MSVTNKGEHYQCIYVIKVLDFNLTKFYKARHKKQTKNFELSLYVKQFKLNSLLKIVEKKDESQYNTAF